MQHPNLVSETSYRTVVHSPGVEGTTGVRSDDTRAASQARFAAEQAAAAQQGANIIFPSAPEQPPAAQPALIQVTYSRVFDVVPGRIITFDFNTPNPTAVMLRYGLANNLPPGRLAGVYNVVGFADTGKAAPALGPYTQLGEELNGDTGVPIRQVGEAVQVYGSRFIFQAKFDDISDSSDGSFVVEFLPFNVNAPNALTMVANQNTAIRIPAWCKEYTITPVGSTPGDTITVVEQDVNSNNLNLFRYLVTSDNTINANTRFAFPLAYKIFNQSLLPLLITFFPNGK